MKDWNSYGGYGGKHFFSRQYKKLKIEWNGSTPADAFRPNLNGTSYQLNARKKLWDICKKQQQTVGAYFQSDQVLAKPQVTYFYLLPPGLAAVCCIGLTTFLEAKEHARTANGLIETYNKDFIEAPEKYFPTEVAPEVLKKLARMIAKVIDNRLLIQLLRYELNIEFVEMYRAISSSLLDMTAMYSLEQCLNANLIYGDLHVPALKRGTLIAHFWNDLKTFNQPYLDSFQDLDDRKFLSAGTEWHHDLTKKVTSYFKGVNPLNKDGDSSSGDVHIIMKNPFQKREGTPHGEKVYINTEDINLLKDDPQGFLGMDDEDVRGVLGELDEDTKKLFNDVANTLNQATQPTDQTGQKAYHQLLDAVQKDPWAKTPIEGIPSGGSEIELRFAGYDMMDVVFEEVLPLSYDFGSIKKLKEKALPISKQLSRMLYVSPTWDARIIKGSSGANFNSSALPAFQVSENLYAKSEEYLQSNQKGESIVVIVGDTSGSNSQDQINCQKILDAGWIHASMSKQNRIEFLAATYDSGSTTGGHSGTMVRWIYNDRFNEARTFDHALSRVDSIKSNGGNSDVKSWARVMAEVNRVIKEKPRLRKAHIYLVLISDCAFNKSFHNTRLTNTQEVQEYVKYIREKEFKDRIHITLVNLGSNSATALDGLVDLKLTISNAEVQDPSQAAYRISSFVSKAIKQQRAKID